MKHKDLERKTRKISGGEYKRRIVSFLYVSTHEMRLLEYANLTKVSPGPHHLPTKPAGQLFPAVQPDNRVQRTSIAAKVGLVCQSVNLLGEPGMTIIVHATKSDIPVVIIDQNRMTDSNALQQLYDEIVDELNGGRETENVLLDFELVETVTSPGLSMLIRAKNKFDEEGARLHLCSLSPNVAAVIETTAFDQLFPVHDSVESAQLALQSP